MRHTQAPRHEAAGTRPTGMPIMRMQWNSLAFIHWPVEPEQVQRLLPRGLEVDTFECRAWVGLVPFTMRDVLPMFVPRVLPWAADIPTFSAFHECNVRTYAHPVGRPELGAVWFFSLDAASRPAVWAARRYFDLPYFHARIELLRNEDEVQYSLRRLDRSRASMQCRWRIGEPLPRSQPGELAHFLTERYALYSSCLNGSAKPIRRCGIWHEPWPLRRGELISLEDGLVRAAGIDVDSTVKPVVHCADKVAVETWLPAVV